jgi:hypothetical protein
MWPHRSDDLTDATLADPADHGGPVGMMKRALLPLCLVLVMAAGLTVTGAAPASAGLTSRNCKDFWTGDHVRRLSVCARVWLSDVNQQERGVVEMHTYIWITGQWYSVSSQSITVNGGAFYVLDNLGHIVDETFFGNSLTFPSGPTTCRVNGPSGPIACSVPNTDRVAFYSTGFTGYRNFGYHLEIQVSAVSWRDDIGRAHFVNAGDNSFPDTLPFSSPDVPI